MSTRSVIARRNGNGFTGVYHHWDGYPSGLGATLFQLRNGHFKGDTQKMLSFLIDQHPAGWSTICGADFSIEPGFQEHGKAPCAVCQCPDWMHYSQYYESHGLPTPPSFDGKSYQVFNHGYKEPEMPQGPQCYCHGDRQEKAGKPMTEKNSTGCGCEWAYVFDGDKMAVCSYCGDGSGKMIGMFGCGDPDGKWRTVAIVDMNSTEPDWEAIQNMEPVSK